MQEDSTCWFEIMNCIHHDKKVRMRNGVVSCPYRYRMHMSSFNFEAFHRSEIRISYCLIWHKDQGVLLQP